ncbi:MAG: O-antigen ligase family protein [Flammeovirgaceae bacterium]
MSLQHFQEKLYGYDRQAFANRMLKLLAIILCLKIWGYFTLSENILITRALKILIRLSMTIATLWVYQQLKNKRCVPSFQYQHTLAPLLYGGYLFLGLCSLLWSTNPGYSLLQLTMNTESFLFVLIYMRTFILLRKFYPESQARLSRLFAPAIFNINLIFIIGMFIFPDQFYRLTHGGEEARLGGYFMNPNELGMLAVVGLAASFIEMQQGANKIWHSFMCAILLFSLVKTGSRSSLIGFMLILGYFLYHSNQQKLKMAVAAGVVLSMPFVISTIFLKQGDVEEVLSMTGRLPFWKALLSEGLPKEPLLGFGYMRIAYTDAFQSVHTYAGKMTHNTFIQVMMNLGLIGFGLILIQMVMTIRAFLQSQLKQDKAFFIGTFIPILINSFTEFGIFGEANFGILFYQFLIFLFVIRYHERLSLRAYVGLE